MRIQCPTCLTEFPSADVNVAVDVAYCKHCQEASKVSELIDSGNESSFDLSNIPSGIEFNETKAGWELTSTTRNWGVWFLIPFTAAWSGFSLTGIYGSQIAVGRFDPGRSLFGLPFLIGTIALVGLCLMTTFGQTRITANDGRGTIFWGLGRYGWRRKFDWSSINQIEESLHYAGQQGNQWLITLRGADVTRFGYFISEPRRIYMLHALRGLLKARGKSSGRL